MRDRLALAGTSHAWRAAVFAAPWPRLVVRGRPRDHNMTRGVERLLLQMPHRAQLRELRVLGMADYARLLRAAGPFPDLTVLDLGPPTPRHDGPSRMRRLELLTSATTVPLVWSMATRLPAEVVRACPNLQRLSVARVVACAEVEEAALLRRRAQAARQASPPDTNQASRHRYLRELSRQAVDSLEETFVAAIDSGGNTPALDVGVCAGGCATTGGGRWHGGGYRYAKARPHVSPFPGTTGTPRCPRCHLEQRCMAIHGTLVTACMEEGCAAVACMGDGCGGTVCGSCEAVVCTPTAHTTWTRCPCGSRTCTQFRCGAALCRAARTRCSECQVCPHCGGDNVDAAHPWHCIKCATCASHMSPPCVACKVPRGPACRGCHRRDRICGDCADRDGYRCGGCGRLWTCGGTQHIHRCDEPSCDRVGCDECAPGSSPAPHWHVQYDGGFLQYV